MKLFTWLLGKMLPDQIKRMIFLSSLAAYVRNLNQPDIETLEKLNEILLLSNNAEALRLPMEISSKIWGKFNIEQLKSAGASFDEENNLSMQGLQKSQMRIVANRLIDHMPKWLKYQSKEGTRQDIYKLFLSLDLIIGRNTKHAQAT